eukprot:gene12003-14683_t
MSTPTTSTTDTASYKQQHQIESPFNLNDDTTPQQIALHLRLNEADTKLLVDSKISGSYLLALDRLEDIASDYPDIDPSTRRRLFKLINKPNKYIFGSFGDTNEYQSEGVNLQAKVITKRENTISSLFKELISKKVLLLRSPPFSGKTSICLLLSNHLQKIDCEIVRFKVNLPTTKLDDELLYFNNKWRETTKNDWEYWLNEETITNNRKRFVIIDEAQIAYKKDYEPFWNRIKELLNLSDNSNIYIFLVATYGEAETRRLTPIAFSSTNSLDLSSILLTESEYIELIENFNNNPNNLSKITIQNEALNYLWTITRGHVGIIRLSLHLLDLHASKTKNILESDDIIAYFISVPYIDQISRTRAVPTNSFNPKERNIIERVLTSKGAPLKNSFCGIDDGIHFRLLEKYGVLVVMTLDNNPIRWNHLKTLYYLLFVILITDRFEKTSREVQMANTWNPFGKYNSISQQNVHKNKTEKKTSMPRDTLFQKYQIQKKEE